MTKSTVYGYRKYSCHIALLTLISFVFLSSCAHTPPEGSSKFDASIKTAEDVDQLKKLETQLTVTPEKAALHPDYQVIDNIAVPYIPEYRNGAGRCA